jgi:calcium-dependent protein kinase
MPEYAGREVLAEYEFGQILGCGTFGVTRLVTHRCTARPWACKTICKASIAASPAAVSDVQHEVAILQHLAGHAGIVQLQGVYEDERNIHLVMELCTGGDLLDYISRFGRLSESEAADIGRVMLTTLQHCHRCVDFRLTCLRGSLCYRSHMHSCHRMLICR